MECLEQKIDEVINLNQWQGFVSGKVVGGLAVLEALNIDKERRIEVLADALGLSIATATDYVNEFFENADK